MLEIVQAGGWLMLPIIACSIVAAAIVLERLWTLRPEQVSPKHLVRQVHEWARRDQLDPGNLKKLHESSPLGQILATALANRYADRDIVKEKIEDSGRHAVHELERYLTSLGTIAAISPLLGLLGTVIGMIKVFAADYGKRRRQSGCARRRNFGGPDHHGRGSLCRDSFIDRVSLSARPRGRPRRSDGKGNGQVPRFSARTQALGATVRQQ